MEDELFLARAFTRKFFSQKSRLANFQTLTSCKKYFTAQPKHTPFLIAAITAIEMEDEA